MVINNGEKIEDEVISSELDKDGTVTQAMNKVRTLAISSLAALGLSASVALAADDQKPILLADASGVVLVNYKVR